MSDKSIDTLARTRLLVTACVGIVTGLIIGLGGNWQIAPILGWDLAALLFIVWVWATVWPMGESQTAAHALAEDPTRAGSDILLLIASVASLAAVMLVLVESSNSSGTKQALLAALGIGSVVLSWVVVHTIYALRYARLYYGHPRGGIDIKGEHQPTYADFAYVAFTVGMTFQVSDTTFTNQAFRKTALRHSLLAYMFGTIIVATTINLIVGLGR